ncbi:MAG: alkaline phosphatase family protein, partial [Phycisphaerae bacterium]
MAEKLLIIDVAALGYDLLVRHGATEIAGLAFHPAETVFPALTCTAQASFRTAGPPGEHGMVANGLFFRELRKPMFWEQSARLVAGERIWSAFRRRGGRVGMLFWQQSLGEDVDVLLSPAPIHRHHGGMIQDCYSRPDWLYRRLCDDMGSPFKLQHYWGPMASYKAGDWIAQA